MRNKKAKALRRIVKQSYKAKDLALALVPQHDQFKSKTVMVPTYRKDVYGELITVEHDGEQVPEFRLEARYITRLKDCVKLRTKQYKKAAKAGLLLAM